MFDHGVWVSWESITLSGNDIMRLPRGQEDRSRASGAPPQIPGVRGKSRIIRGPIYRGQSSSRVSGLGPFKNRKRGGLWNSECVP